MEADYRDADGLILNGTRDTETVGCYTKINKEYFIDFFHLYIIIGKCGEEIKFHI